MSTIWRVLRVVSRCWQCCLAKKAWQLNTNIKIYISLIWPKIQCQLFLFCCAYHDFGTAVFANSSHFPHKASSINKSTFLLYQFLFFFLVVVLLSCTIQVHNLGVLIVYYTHLHIHKKKIECGSKDSRKMARQKQWCGNENSLNRAEWKWNWVMFIVVGGKNYPLNYYIYLDFSFKFNYNRWSFKDFFFSNTYC